MRTLIWLKTIKYKKNSSKKEGFTLVELTAAMLILLTASLGMLSVMVTLYQLDRMSKEEAAAAQILRRVAETIEASIQSEADLETCYNNYRSNTKGFDWPWGGFTNADVDELKESGLANIAMNTNGKPVKIETYVDENDTELRKWYPDPDLNANGTSTDNLQAGGYQILPLKLTIEWDSALGKKQTLSMYIMLGAP